MGNLFKIEDNSLIREYNHEKIRIEPWGENSLRLRASMQANRAENRDWALMAQPGYKSEIKLYDNCASITNGKITCIIDPYGVVHFENQKGEILLKEYWRNRQDKEHYSSLMIAGREYKPITGGSYQVTVRWEGNERERLYGMGQRQEPFLNLKGCDLELAQRNSQVNIPFLLSNLGYGFLWHNPAYGRVTLARNATQWTAHVSELIDYWITAGDNFQELIGQYTQATGRVPMLPEYAAGFWQCKLRYHNQEELLNVAREYKKRGLPLSVIVIDFFHWLQQGEWSFDPRYWPDPGAMVKELDSMGIKLMVSIWPTVDPRSKYYSIIKEKGYLIRTDRGVQTQFILLGNESYFDFTNPEARQWLWNRIKENYFKYGIKLFWLDEAEPEMSPYDFDNIRYHLGTNLEIGNLYPLFYAKTFYDGMTSEGIENVINLSRCAWAGSQRYGTAVWSGDIHSDFHTLRIQVRAGLNMGLSGIPWWTTDIGGFYGGDPEDPQFRELIIRWFQFGVFCPIFRLHGYRYPNSEGTENEDTGEFDFNTCGPNEVWSYGVEAYRIISNLLHLRERLTPYILKQMEAAHTRGTPCIRPLFYDFPADPKAWEIEDQFMFGPDILVAPILYEGAVSRDVYLPAGCEWYEKKTNSRHKGGQSICSAAPLDVIPVFLKNDASHPI